LNVACGRAADLILRGGGRDKREALDVKVKFQNVRDFAAEPFEGNRNGFGLTENVNLLLNLDFILTAGKMDGGGREKNRQTNFKKSWVIFIRASVWL
jgi:hypothetical protein